MKRKQFSKMAKKFGLSKEAARRAWVMLKTGQGTDLYGQSDAARTAFCDFVNRMS